MKVEDLAIKTNLVELTFNKTAENLAKLDRLYRKQSFAKDYLLISHGVGEISIITLASAKRTVLDAFVEKPKAVIESLVSVTLRLGGNYIDTPNVTYKFVREFAHANISIVELISTYSEMSFIVYEKDSQKALAVLSKR